MSQGGRDECLYRLGRMDDAAHWKFVGGGLGLGPGTMRIKVTLMITKTMKATQVANHTIGNLYFSLLDHPGSRGPGFTVTPAPSSESRV